MSKSLKIILASFGGLIGLLVLVGVALRFFVDANVYKPRLEASVSEALGMEFRVGGRLRIGVFPGLFFTLKDVRIRNRGTDVATAREATLEIGLFSLLRKGVRIGKIALKHPRITIEQDRDGRFNFETPELVLTSLDLAEVSLSDATLVYADKQSGGGFDAGDCSLDMHRLRLSAGKSPDRIENYTFTAELDCGKFQRNDLTAADLRFSADGKNGIVDFKPVTMRLMDGNGSATIRADFSGAVPVYHVKYALAQFRVEELFEARSPQKVAEGLMDFSADLSMRGKTVTEMKQTAEGQISLRGENLTVNGRDLDKEFSRFESSQNFNLVDVGAVFLAGPFGLVVTKGYDFATIFQESGTSSRIRTLVSDWKVERGVAQAQDVALATTKNRIAFQGGLDFGTGQYKDVTMALINDKGCATVRQKIRGAFEKPVVEKPNIVKTLSGPALRLLEKGKELLPGGECDVFYAGSVAPPK